MTGTSNVVEWAGIRARALALRPALPLTGLVSAGGALWAAARHFPFSTDELRTLIELTVKLAAVGTGGRVCLALVLLAASAPFVFWLRGRQTAVAREMLDLASDWALQLVGVLVLGPAWVVSWRAVNHLYFNEFPQAWWCMAMLVPLHFCGNVMLWMLPPPPPPVEPGVMDILVQIYHLIR